MQEIKNAPNELDEDSVLEHFKYTTIDVIILQIIHID